jgi:hypothetical protein
VISPKREITLPGRIAVDERRISYVTAHFEGRIHDVKIDFTGAPIRKGEVMATIYSQEVVSAQRELLEAHRNRERNPGCMSRPCESSVSGSLPMSRFSRSLTAAGADTY